MNIRREVFITISILFILLGAYLLYRLSEIIVLLFAAIIFASAIRPFVDMLERRGVHRSLAILSIYIVVLSGITGLLIVAVPPVIRFTVQLSSEGLITEQLRSLATRLAIFGWDQFNLPTMVLTLPSQLQVMIGEASESAQEQARQQAWPLARNTLLVLSQIILGLAMGYYWLNARERTLDLLLKISPPDHRLQVKRIWDDIESTLGAYVRGQSILMLAVGIMSFIGLFLLDVPYALALAVIAGLTEAIPLVGPFLGAIPAVLVGLSVSPITALLVAGLYVIVQQLEGNILVPKVMEKSLGLNPLLVIIALVAGGVLNGIVGALLAIPIAGALQVLTHHLFIVPAIENNGSVEGEVELPSEKDEDDVDEPAGVAVSAAGGGAS